MTDDVDATPKPTDSELAVMLREGMQGPAVLALYEPWAYVAAVLDSPAFRRRLQDPTVPLPEYAAILRRDGPIHRLPGNLGGSGGPPFSVAFNLLLVEGGIDVGHLSSHPSNIRFGNWIEATGGREQARRRLLDFATSTGRRP